MIDRYIFETYIDMALETVRKMCFIAQDRADLAPGWNKEKRDSNIDEVRVNGKVIVRLAPGLRECPVSGEIRTTTVHLSDKLSSIYALLPYVAWHYYVQDHPQSETIQLASEISPLTKRLMKHLGVTRDELSQAVLSGQTLQKRDHYLQFSQRMDEIITISYAHGPLSMSYETTYNVGIGLSQTVLEGLSDLKGKPVQILIDAPFMEKSKGRIIHASGSEYSFSARVEEDPIIADLWNGKRTTRHDTALRIWDHLEMTQVMLAD